MMTKPHLHDLLTEFGQAYHKLLTEGAEHAPRVEAAEAAIQGLCSAAMTNDEIIQQAAHAEASRRWPKRGDDPEKARAFSAFMAGVRFALTQHAEPKATLAKTASGGTLRCGQHGLPNEIQGDRIGCRKCFEVNRKR